MLKSVIHQFTEGVRNERSSKSRVCTRRIELPANRRFFLLKWSDGAWAYPVANSTGGTNPSMGSKSNTWCDQLDKSGDGGYRGIIVKIELCHSS